MSFKFNYQSHIESYGFMRLIFIVLLFNSVIMFMLKFNFQIMCMNSLMIQQFYHPIGALLHIQTHFALLCTFSPNEIFIHLFRVYQHSPNVSLDWLQPPCDPALDKRLQIKDGWKSLSVSQSGQSVRGKEWGQ